LKGIVRAIITAAALLFSLWVPNASNAGDLDHEVCDVGADYYLGIEDYSEAIRHHIDIVRRQPDNALAHYHLGYALGMVGERTEEIKEYQTAVLLGLKNWDLLLNLGLAQLEEGNLSAAAESLRHAVLLGEDHPESHFNLALIDARRGMLADAEREALESLRLDPKQQGARNLLAVIYARRNMIGVSQGPEPKPEGLDSETSRLHLNVLGHDNSAPDKETGRIDLSHRSALTP
jgi:tetratricopeptide (TPR) repeat protein